MIRDSCADIRQYSHFEPLNCHRLSYDNLSVLTVEGGLLCLAGGAENLFLWGPNWHASQSLSLLLKTLIEG
jgi:hypothetical protein